MQAPSSASGWVFAAIFSRDSFLCKLISVLVAWAMIMSSMPVYGVDQNQTARRDMGQKVLAHPPSSSFSGAAWQANSPGQRASSARTVVSQRPLSKLASLRTPSLLVDSASAFFPDSSGGGSGGQSSITSNFNGTAIAAGNYVWFSSVVKTTGLGSAPVRIFLRNATVQFAANGVNYNLAVPDALITYVPSGTTATTAYDPNRKEWVTIVPSTGLAGNVLLSGFGLLVPNGGLPAGVNPVTWSGTFYTDTAGVSVNWQWAAAVYTTFNSDLNTLGVKPVDDNHASQYQNSDHAGAPENYKSEVTGGARGGGGSDYTGSLSGTANIVPVVQVPNYPPEANAGPAQTVHVTDTVQVDGTGSTDRDGDLLTYRWTLTSIPTGSTAVLNVATTAKSTFVVDKPGSYIAQLIVNDGKVDSAPSTVAITTTNSVPVANAGPDQTARLQTTVQLNGSGSTDVDGDRLSYQWTLMPIPPGSNAQLSSTTAINPTFLVDAKGTYIAQLVVNDGHLNSAPDTVTISTVNSPPVANPGPQQKITVGRTVTLDGHNSTDVDGDLLTFRWSLLSAPAGSTAVLSNPTSVTPSFVPDQLGDYVVQLIVNDGAADSQPATVTITSGDTAPVANAGPARTAQLGSTVALDGSASSDADGHSLTYHWSLTAPIGSNAALVNSDTPNPSFIADVMGNYVAQLIVNDGFLNSVSATVVISTINSVPVADVGDGQKVLTGTTVHLDGSASSDADGDPLTYRWAIIVRPDGSTAALSDPTAPNPAFVLDVEGAYVIQLIVNDGTVDSTPVTLMILAENPNRAPVVNAGSDQTITLPNDTLTLNGTATDDGKPAGVPLKITWTQVSGPAPVTFSDATSAVTQATFAGVGDYVLRLTGDDSLLSSSDDVTVTVKPRPNDPPVVSAGDDQTVPFPNHLQLQGSVTDDGRPVGATLTSTWSQVSGPSQAFFTDIHSPTTTVKLDAVGSYKFRLTGDDSQLQTSAEVTITTVQGNRAPVVTVGAEQTIALPINTARLSGTATDPQNSPMTFAWTQVSGPATVAFSNPSSLNTSATFTTAGSYVLRLTVTDSLTPALAGSADVHVVVLPSNQAPVVSAGPDQLITWPQNVVALNGSVSDDGLPVGGPLTTSWSFVSGPAQVSFANASRSATTVTFFEVGTYVLRLTANDSQLSSASEVTVVVKSNRLDNPPKIVSQPVTQATLDPGYATRTAANLRAWTVVQYGPFSPGQGVANWVIDSTNTVATQLNNSDASILLSDFDFSNSRIEGDWQVTANDDVDPIGFVFGYQDSQHFYLFDWKAASSCFVNCDSAAGMHIKVVSADSPLTALDLWPDSGSGNRVKIIYRNSVPWQRHVLYHYVLTFHSGQINVTVQQGSLVLASFTIQDNTYTSGKFGFYNYSQGGVQYRGFTRNVLTNYSYNVVGIDPDGDQPTYSLIAPPNGMTIDPMTGLITWGVGLQDVGAHQIMVKAQETSGLFDTQVYTLNVVGPQSVSPHGTLSLSPPTASHVFSEPQQLTAVFLDTQGNPVPNANITFTVTGSNHASGVVTTDNTGTARFSYMGTAPGSDGVVAAVSTNGITLNSNAAAIQWTIPLQVITTSTVVAQFFASDGSGTFDIPATQTPLFKQTFENLAFNADGGTVAGTPGGSFGDTTHPFTDLVADVLGNYIGTIVARGTLHSAVSDTSVTVPGKGRQIFGGDDEFHFRYKVLHGDGMITARMVSVGNPQANAGVMIRNDLTNGSINAYMFVTSSSGVFSQWRTNATAATATPVQASTAAAPYWVRLKRTGNHFTTYASPDGTTWNQITDTILSISADCYIGLAVTSNDFNQLNFSTFDNIQIDANTDPDWIEADIGPALQIGNDALSTFQAVYTGSFNVSRAGNISFIFHTNDGFIFGLGPNTQGGGNPQRIGGNAPVNLPPSGLTPFNNYPVLGAYNQATGTIANTVTVNFPTPGVYPFEIDYTQCCDTRLQMVVASDVTNNLAIPPVASVGLRSNFNGNSDINTVVWDITFTASVMDASGYPASGVPVVFTVTGANNQTFTANTDLQGNAFFRWLPTHSNVGNNDTIRATAALSGAVAMSNEIHASLGAPVNTAPRVNAGSNQTVFLPASTTLSGTVADDGRSGTALTTTWTQISGPATAIIANPSALQTRVSFTTPGNYTFQLSANDGQITTTSTVTVVVIALTNFAPVISIQADQSTITLPTSVVNVSGIVIDDGLPAGAAVTQQWSTVSGPASAVFSNPQSPTTQITFPAAGTYELRLTASDTALTSSQDLLVTVQSAGANQPPIVIVGAPITLTQPQSSITLSAQVSDDGLPNNSLTLEWYQASGPSQATISSPHAAFTDAQLVNPGTYTFTLVASDGQLTTSGTVTVMLQANPNGPPQGPPPTVSIDLVAGSEITKPRPITGTISAGSYVLQYAPNNSDDPTRLKWTTFAQGTAPISGPLGTFDPTVLLNGEYLVRAVATDVYGQITTASTSATVDRNLKVGNFTLAFQDLSVPMPGLPLTVTRTYDSRDKTLGDFGVGWRVSVANVRVQKNGAIGIGWNEDVSWSGITDQYCLEPTKNHFVTITFPDDKAYKFQAVSSPECTRFGPNTAPNVAFQQVSNGAATAGATLVALGFNQVLVDGAIPGPQNLFAPDGSPYNPTQFQLTTAEGYVYTLDQSLGATQVTDPNGNTLTITANGITHSSGKSVAFTHDTQGRITAITDPDVNSDPVHHTISYFYDADGNLDHVTDREQNTTNFHYDPNHPHYLQKIDDPRGVQAIRNVYDDSGRLTDTCDASGNCVHYDHHQLAANTEVITDRRLNVTAYEYDDDGNVVRKTQTVSGVQLDSVYTYDANDNKTSELLPGHAKPSFFTYDSLGNQLTQTNPLGHTTTYTYNGRKQVTSIKDANTGAQQGTTTNVYDPQKGNLLSTTDAEGHISSYTYFGNGQVATTTVDGVQTASFAYDGIGNLTDQTDAVSVRTSYTYDLNGNRKTQKVTRTLPGNTTQDLITTYFYDGNNRLTKTQYPDLTTITQVRYNAIGKQSDTIDALNRATHYDYDDQGHLSTTTYPDQTTEVTTYDANGNRKTFKDRGGHITTYDYDELNRLTKTHFADGSFTETVYDAAGRVSDSYDQLRNKTHYDYDDADRRVAVTDALNKKTQFGYDNSGNQISITDANQHTTAYVYDKLGRRTQVIYHDQSTETTHYDSQERVDYKIDQAGKRTDYGYDLDGRLTSVTQHLAGSPDLITRYGYDKVGNRTSQTDASQHTTSYTYDELGRRKTRMLPLGQTETYTYDAAGNLHLKTDFNGHTTTYDYDPNNRLTSKTADAFFSTGSCAGGACGATQISFTYTATGKRKTMTDAIGTTTYNYDPQTDRLLSKVTPFGTLTYTYDNAGNLQSISSSNSNGASMAYSYDADNRLKTVTDASGVTNYSYDNVGNLQSFTYPNGVQTGYTYNTLNRLTSMQSRCASGTGCGAPGTAVSSYAYTLGPAGNRLSVAELSGRTVQYAYDDLYRLTSESVSADPADNNGAVSYSFDAVGNRLQRNSTLPAIPATGLLNYDANDRTSTDPYDANGNLLNGGAGTNVYDFENRLVQAGGVKLVYDVDGNRISETVAGVTTKYLVADQNLTGYAQVLDEVQGTVVTHTYSYGLELINQRQSINGTPTTSFYGYDGHGSVRFLTDSSGAITDTYDYDAFGNLISSTGNTPNNYLFAGEQFDLALGIYYNRARYYDERNGRFWTADSFEGNDHSPSSLHKYEYTAANPVNNADPNGHFLEEEISAVTIDTTLFTISAIALLVDIRGDLRQGDAEQPPSPTATSTNENSIEIYNSPLNIDQLFQFVSQFDGVNDTNVATVSGAPVSGIGQKLTFQLRASSPIGVLSGIFQSPFSVRTDRYDSHEHTISVVTLQGHPLRGYRYWRVYSPDDRPGHFVIQTGALDEPGPGPLDVVKFGAGRTQQLGLWQAYLRDALSVSKGREGSDPSYDYPWGLFGTPTRNEVLEQVTGVHPQ